ncbi:thioredoxin-like protein [Rhodocollybia butyracea]|uniref:Thioredoxin-like protein n=1 Tax=Rhodocollybia butyracea TaxID=206335 RepID=A0A9P5PY23_9AGAR|nr:thioredoxin-like protein [Rhodocollybia butyracea]
MYADIEALVLSGELFNGPERSSSPTRSVSPSSEAGWHDEDLQNFTDESKPSPKVHQDHQESIGMGPGRTGVKGVIRDRDEAEELNRQKRNVEMEDMRLKMEKSHLGGKTFLQEERMKGPGEKVDELVMKEREKERTDVFGRTKDGRFGHLREVDVHNYLSAVEKEERGVWVVVHLYESSLDRCFILDDTLAHLARMYPDTKFLRCRAAALGFASTSKPRLATPVTRPSRSIRAQDDDDDGLFDEKDLRDDDDEDDPYGEDDVDLDMLPTMLVYRDGELVHNWVRVDWEAGEGGVEELLDRYHILPKTDTFFGNFSVPSDDDEDLIWSEEDS